MKNKSTRHKELNTFKFQPFSERLSKIDIDIFHKVRHEYESETEESECIFYQTIQKWNVLNLSEGYDKFKKEVRAHKYVTLPQLLLAKDHVVEILLKHLSLRNPLCLQPLLEVVTAVAQDLQKEFYTYYPQFFEVLINLLNTKDTEQLEWMFTCLAYLFKFLWRPLIKDISNVFHMLLPLLSDSKPDYITSFAAESFAFVARKVKDRKAFLQLLVNAVKTTKDGVSGCGKLLFEVINGVDGEFHSCADSVLPFYLASLSDSTYPKEILNEILEQIIANIVFNIHPQKSDLLWECFKNLLGTFIEKYTVQKSEILTEDIDTTLKLLGQAVEYKSGRFLKNPTLVKDVLIKLLNVELPESVLLTVIQIAVLLLLSKNIKLPQEQVSQIIRKVLSLKQKNILLYFVENVHSCTSFEVIVLQSFLKSCADYDLDQECLYALTKLILKKVPLSTSGVNLLKWSKYVLDFRENNIKVLKILEDHLKFESIDDINNYLCSLICIPHLNVKEKETTAELLLKKNLEIFLEALDTNIDDESYTKKMLFLINQTLECMVHLHLREILAKDFETISGKLLTYSTNLKWILALKSLSLLISAVKNNDDVITMATLENIDNVLRINLSSPYHEVRLLTTHIYSLFDNLPEFKLRHSADPETPPEDWKVFSILHQVEAIDPQVHTYRDQLQNLEKLNFDKPQMLMCNQTKFNSAPLRYLCGTLYINFQLLWEPVSKIIATHALGLDTNLFWSIFGEELKNICERVLNPVQFNVVGLGMDVQFLDELFEASQKIEVEPDFVNYRILLWKAMVHFANVAEAKTRDVSEVLLKFVEIEYLKSNSDMGTVCNIKQNSLNLETENAEKTDLEEEQSNENIEEENDDENKDNNIKNGLTKRVANSRGKMNIKTLQSMLAVFSKIRSPLSMYREPDLYKLYFDLLQHKNSEIQKLALDCIMTYKFKYITPYKENLYNLVNDKNFKNEITAFQLDKESSNVLEEHRENLLPIVMQIVFSKMSGKGGLRTGGKASGQNRRNLVLRFLAGCKETEMISFTQKSFRFYSKYVNTDDPSEILSTVSQNFDLEKFIPPKKLQSTINLLNVILEQFGGLMGDNLLTYLLKVVFCLGAFIKNAFDHVTNIHSGFLAALKNLRTSCIKVVERFFDHFDKYIWTNKQINAVFDLFVWPYLPKLNTEGIHSPTNLLKLFKAWAANPRYFSLFVKYKDNDKSEYVLPYVVKLLVNEKSHPTVVSCILEMIENLLKLQPDDDDVPLALPVDNLLPIEKSILERVKVNEKLNYGSCILLPHVPTILQKIKRKLEGKNKNLNQRELFILSRISELVWEADISDGILKLLLPVTLKKCNSNEEVIQRFLSTTLNLIQNVVEPQNHLKQISPLFAEVTYPSCRKVLAKILDVTANKNDNETLKLGSYLITELNAWDVKWLDQPDFERRHNAFRKIQEHLREEKIDQTLGVLLIHNFYFLMKNEKDLSLKENSSHNLKQLCCYLLQKYKGSQKDVDYILNDTLFNLIRNGMKSINSDFRYESISLLGYLARECPNSHFILRDLNRYTNKVDLEVDFFENLTHMQLHRHARALLKFCQITRTQTVAPNPRTLTQFVLPLVSYYLCTEKYVSKNSLIDAAIEAVGVICKLLPWHQYEGILKYYLSRLRFKVEYQKQLVRLTVAILDSFHFDLSKGHVQVGGAVVETNKEATEVVKEIVDKDENDESSQGDQEPQEVEDGIGVDELLENLSEHGDDEEAVIEDNAAKKEVPNCEKVTVLCKSTATRVIKTIQITLLPQLHKSLASLTQHEASHKVNRRKTGVDREEEDLLRVPISLAVVKLLQRLPKEILELNLPGVFMKLCTFLKSHLESVRRVTRETLQKIMLTLGPKYLKLLLSEMAPLLSRGFQVHVLVFTIHGVLNCLRELYEPTDVDVVLLTVLDLCRADLFGALSEEKEIAKIATKTSEAKSTKSYDTLQILAQNITETCLTDMLLPIKQVLENSHSFKTVHKAQDALRHIALGLVDNSFISTESLLKFAYGASSEGIPELLPVKKRPLSRKDKDKLQREKEDCFIIPKIPGNRTAYRQTNVKTAVNTNAHLLVEFGLRLCFVLLKRDRVRERDYRPFIDPFVGVFKDCLKSKHVKLGTLTLQCLTGVMKYDLPSMREHVKSITKDIFGILHKYASAGLSKGDNFDLVVAAFKATAVLVRDVKYHTIDTTQLKVLLLYAEQDMHDHDRQATAFNLLKAIITRKLIVPEIHDVMEKVAELSIVAELNHVRSQARTVFHQFIMEYPLGNTLEKHLGFYISQMSYEMQYGRESAIEMIQSLINSFPATILKAQSPTLLITLGARLVNDEVPECRKMVAECISSMFKKLQKADRDQLFDILILWLKDRNISHRRLSAQLCGILVTVEKDTFESRLSLIVPLILKQFGIDNTPGKFVKLQTEKPSKESEEAQRVKDHHYFQVLQLVLKICANCPGFLKQKNDIENLAVHAQSLLAYPHDWVRLASAQFLGYVLSSIDVNLLAKHLLDNTTTENTTGYLFRDPKNSIKSLTLDLCDQLQPGDVKTDLAEQVIKNLVFIARVLEKVPLDISLNQKINLLWLTKRMRKIVNQEVTEAPSSGVMRTEVFKWIAGVGTALDLEQLKPLLHHLLAPLVREMITTEEKNAPLRQLSKEVAGILKKKVGLELYTETLQKLQQTLSVKRAERKRSRTQLAVTDPEAYAKKKIKRQEKKKISKKRKIADMKGKKVFKKRKVVDLEDNTEVI